MPAQKRPAPPRDGPAAADDSPASPTPPPPPEPGDAEHPPPPSPPQEPAAAEEEDSEDDEESYYAYGGPDRQYMALRLTDVRREVQCPICLGIIRKTRTVMECLHRFCRECIDKSMRLGNNECPACRAHCASRRSLRDDTMYDTLISALYPNIDKYEEEEMAFYEEEMKRNRKIQLSIAETLRRQSEALGRRRSAAFTRRLQGNLRNAHGQSSYLQGRGRSGNRNASLTISDDDEEGDDVNSKNQGKDSSSAEEHSPDVRPKRCKRWAPPRTSPGRTAGNAYVGGVENDDAEVGRENHAMSPLRAGNREMLAWGKGGARSQTRHGNTSSSNGRFVKDGRVTKFVEYLRNLNENDDEFDVHYTVVPLNEQSTPHLQRPHLCSPSTVAIGQLCKYIADVAQCCLPNEVEILVRRRESGILAIKPSDEMDKLQSAPASSEELRIVAAEETLAGLCAAVSANRGDLVLFYRLKNADLETK